MTTKTPGTRGSFRGQGNNVALKSTPSDVSETFPLVPSPHQNYLLPPPQHEDEHKICMVIDLDGTLVHRTFVQNDNADFVVSVEIKGKVEQLYILKRPFVDDFLRRMGELYECVLFTASPAKCSDPVVDVLDQWGVFRTRLHRESCVVHENSYAKDLSKLGRNLQKVVIVDDTPESYALQPDNAVVETWYGDRSDTELRDLIPHLERLSKVDDVFRPLREIYKKMVLNSLRD